MNFSATASTFFCSSSAALTISSGIFAVLDFPASFFHCSRAVFKAVCIPSIVCLAFFLRRRLVLRFVFRGVFLVHIVFVFFRRFRRYSFLQVVAQKRAVRRIFGGEHFLPRAPAAVPYEPSCRRARREERQW